MFGRPHSEASVPRSRLERERQLALNDMPPDKLGPDYLCDGSPDVDGDAE